MIYGDTKLPQRFWSKVYPEPNTGCWLWGAARSGGGSAGYGDFALGTRDRTYAHRLMCLTAHGQPPKGKSNALHSCDMSLCVNPDHLRWGTKKQNTEDMILRGRHFSPQRNVTHCWRGHEFTEENTHTYRGKRICKKCRRINLREWEKRTKV